MKNPIFIIFSVLTFISVCSCNKMQEQPGPQPERELSIPEKVEKELMEILSKDWKSLSDTLEYFDSTMLSKGKFKGTAPDGVYYELSFSAEKETGPQAVFKVEDSTWAAINGRIIPLGIRLNACDTEISFNKELKDSTSLSVSVVKVIAPLGFLFEKDHRAPLLYKESRVGYLTREDFENTDYSTGTYLVVHYYNDNRTFALYDNGLCSLLKKKPPYAVK